jgi:hypothetical protein
VIRKIAFEHWQQTLPHPGAHAAQVVVGRVLAPGLTDLPQVLAQSSAPFAEQRPDDAARLGVNAGKSSRTGPAEQMPEHGFRLIVFRLRHGDPAHSPLRNQALKKGVSHPSPGVFQVPLVFGSRRQDVAALNDAFEPHPARQLVHGLGVRIRLRAPKQMVEMDYD